MPDLNGYFTEELRSSLSFINKIKKRTEVIVPQTVAQLESDYAEQHGQVVLYLEMLSPKKSMI